MPLEPVGSREGVRGVADRRRGESMLGDLPDAGTVHTVRAP